MAEENKTVDVSTDNLDDFNDLWEGRASETAKEESQEDPVEEPTDEEEPTEEPTEEEVVEEVNDDDDDSVATEKEEPKAKPKKNSAQERIDELTKNWRETQRELEALKAERQKQNEPNKEQEETKEPETESKAPDHTDRDKYPLGDLDPQYLADRQDFMLEKRIAELDAQRAKQEEQREAQARAEAIQTEWDQKLAAAEEKHEDYRETVQSLESAFDGVDPQSGQFIAETIMGMETGTDVLYHLAKNPALARDIATQSPVNAALALGRLEAELAPSSAPTKPARKQSKAPTPPKGVNKGSTTSMAVRPDTDDQDAFDELFFAKQ